MITNTKINKLIEKLKAPDPSIRRRAAEALSEGGERALYPLIKILRDKNMGVQDAAMRSLISIGQEMSSGHLTPMKRGEIFDVGGHETPDPSCNDSDGSISRNKGEVVAYMVLPLLRDDSYLRNTAIIILRELGAVSVPLLYPLLFDKDEDVRKFSLDLLSDIKMGVRPEKIVPFLKDPNANVRASAAKTMAALKYYDALPLLLEGLKDEEWVAFSILETLGELKDERAVGPISGLLSGESDALRFAALEALGSIASPLCIQPLRDFISKTDSLDKMVAIKSLLKIGISPDMSDLSSGLMDMLESEEWDDRLLALKGIVTLKYFQAVPVIVDLAGSLDMSVPENEELLLTLQDALIRMNAEEALMELLKDDNVLYRGKTVAIQVLGSLKSRMAVPDLIEILRSSYRDMRRAGAKALGEIEALEALPSLIEAMEDEDGHVRKAAVVALGKIGDGSAYGPLLQLLKRERYKDIVEETVKALLQVNSADLMANLDKFGDEIKELVARLADDLDVLLKLSKETNKNLKVHALLSLGRGNWGPASDKALSRMIEALKDDDPEIRKNAVISIGEMGHCPKELGLALRDEDMWVRFYAVKAVASSGKEEMTHAIVPMLSDPELPVAFSAIEALGEVGGRDAVAALDALREHEDPEIRERANQALERII